jgi:hypothetical protein
MPPNPSIGTSGYELDLADHVDRLKDMTPAEFALKCRSNEVEIVLKQAGD